MAIELIDKIKPKNGGSFAMVDAEDVEMPNGRRLSEFEEGATEEQANQIQENKQQIEAIGETLSKGTKGQFAISDGQGGITWLTVIDGNEVAF